MAGNLRKEAKIIKNPKYSNVEHLNIESMVLKDKSNAFFFMERLRYRGVPTCHFIKNNKGNVKAQGQIINAERDNVIREIYRLLSSNNGICDKTEFSYLRGGLVVYFRYLDEHEPEEIPFSITSLRNCIRHLNNLKLKGITPSLSNTTLTALCYFLIKMERDNDANTLRNNSVYRGTSGKQSAFDIETELKPIADILIRGHKAFINHLENDSLPEIHPFYNQKMVNDMADRDGLIGSVRGPRHTAFKQAIWAHPSTVKKSSIDEHILNWITVFNQASRCALYLFFMMTGMNDSALKSMRRSDVSFRDVGTGNYIFNSIKGRVNYQEQDNALAFSKRTKEIIEEWLRVSKTIFNFIHINESKIGNKPLFPYVNIDLQLHDFTYHGSHSGRINRLISKLLPVHINATRFRKTKADLLMRVTQDMYIVSQGLNNSINVVQKRYSGGVLSDHKQNLSAAMEAQASIAKGVDIEESISTAKILHSDILNDYDYKEKLNQNIISLTTITPSGVRCKGDESTFSLVERKIKNLSIEMPDDEKKCTDFLSCFDCDNHILVASESDIWLMLSFKEKVTELKNITAQNSVPKEKLYQIEEVLARTLLRLKKKAQQIYQDAENKLEEHGPHPLYANLRSLTDTLGVFNV